MTLRRASLLALLLLLLGAAALAVSVRRRAPDADPVRSLLALATTPRPAPADPVAATAGHLPSDELARLVEAQVRLVPGAGALRSPAQLLAEREGTGLDRARLLVALLEAAGRRARLVQSAERAPAGDAAPGGASAAFDEELAELGPRLWARVAGERAWLDGARAPAPTGACWAQVYEGDWRDLPLGGVAGPWTPIDAAELTARSWTVTLRVLAVDTAGGESERLVFTRPAEELHGAPLAVAMVPDGSLDALRPTVLLDRQVIAGQPVAREGCARLLLVVETVGPDVARSAVRDLAVAPEEASDAVTGLALCGVARLAITTGRLADVELQAAVQADLALAGDALIEQGFEGDVAPSWRTRARHALRGLALLRRGRDLAGQVGATAGLVRAWQARPAVVVERLSTRIVAGAGGGRLVRSRGLDLVDPGHGFAPRDGQAPELAARAAVEQAIVDGRLEALALGSGATTSIDLLGQALRDGDELASERPAGAWSDGWSTTEGHVAAGYRTTSARGQVVGLRLDPGPQVVPILVDGTGGANQDEMEMTTQEADDAMNALDPTYGARQAEKADRAQQAREEVVRKAADFVSDLLPPEALPAGFVLKGILGHLERVAKAYRQAGSFMDLVGQQIAGEEVDPAALDALAKQLEATIRGFGKELAFDFAKEIFTGVFTGFPANAGGIPESLRGLVDHDRQVVLEGLRDGTIDHLADAARRSDGLREAGFSEAERREYFSTLDTDANRKILDAWLSKPVAEREPEAVLREQLRGERA